MTMAESYEKKYSDILVKTLVQNYETYGNEHFTFIELIESIRSSEIAHRFDFVRFHREMESRQNGEYRGHPSLFSKPLRALKSTNRYDSPQLYETSIEIPWFDQHSMSWKEKTPLIRVCNKDYQFYPVNINTIPQLLTTLKEVFPLIDAIQEELNIREEEIQRMKEIQEVAGSIAPMLLEETFRGYSLPYCYKLGRDFLEVRVKLPYHKMAQFDIRFDKLDESIPEILEEVLRLKDVCKNIGLVRLDRITDEKWISPENKTKK